MNGLLTAGRIFFAMAMVFFGVQFFIFVSSTRGPLPGPPWSHGMLSLDWLACVGFIVAGVGVAARRRGWFGGVGVGGGLLSFGLVFVGRGLGGGGHTPGPVAALFERLSLVVGAGA